MRFIILLQMGNANSVPNSKINEASYSTCTGRGTSGLNEYCYNTGYDHGRGMSLHHPDPIGEGISVLPCHINDNANKCYTKGYTDGMSGHSVGILVGNNREKISAQTNNQIKNIQNTQTNNQIKNIQNTQTNNQIKNIQNTQTVNDKSKINNDRVDKLCKMYNWHRKLNVNGKLPKNPDAIQNTQTNNQIKNIQNTQTVNDKLPNNLDPAIAEMKKILDLF